MKQRVDSLSNMTGNAMWNRFVNVTQSDTDRSQATPKEQRAAAATALEEQLDQLNTDFVTATCDITHKQVSFVVSDERVRTRALGARLIGSLSL